MTNSNIKTFLFSLFSGARINLIGQLFGSEVFALLFLPYKKIFSFFRIYPFKQLTIPYLFFIIALIISDIFINNTGVDNFLRGWASVIFSLIQLIFLFTLFTKSENNYNIFLISSAISFFIFRPEMNSEFVLEGNDFKVYYMAGVNYLILFIGYYLGKKKAMYVFVLFFSYSLFCMIADARSNGVVYFFTGLLLIIKMKKIKLTKDKLVMIFLLILIIGYCSYIIYVNSVLKGEIGGSNAQQLKSLNNPYNPIELIVTGRKEALFPIYPIKDHFVFGLGSWAEDNSGKYIKLYNSMIDGQPRESKLIPAHSIFFATWLWSGILGVISVVLIYFRAFKMAFTLYTKTNKRILILILPLLFDQIWNFFFSPMGHMRISSPFFLAITAIEFYKYIKYDKKTSL
ncbi:hypothetical protein [Empedobacter sp.]|uniref:hypothetical protein n=1 Tax=Empedobacter sp. TaxID=1927715 RepID=UPI0028979123|nr:hypothetical protein [Empedobacter sp.]